MIEIHRGKWILGCKGSSTTAIILRWIARLWSLLVLALALVIIFTPDPYATHSITFREVFMLSFWGLAILGLILAWRWELFGALLTLIIMPVRELIYIVLYREWTINFLLIWALVIPPAVLFLVAWSLDRKKQAQLSGTKNLGDDTN